MIAKRWASARLRMTRKRASEARGSITDVHGGDLAVSVERRRIVADPTLVVDYERKEEGPDGERLANYRALFDAHQDAMHKASSAIRAANDTGTPLGNDRFKQQVEDALGQKVGQARRGRPTGFKPPRKNKQDKQQRALKGL